MVLEWAVEIDLVFVAGHRNLLRVKAFYIALALGVQFHVKIYAKTFK